MDKKVMIGVGVVIIVIIAIFIFSGGSEEVTSTTPGAGSSSSVSNEEQKYAEFEAELTCELLGAESAEDIVAIMEKTVSVMQKYGYDDAEYNRLKTKYANDNDFKTLVISEMEKECPELVDKASL